MATSETQPEAAEPATQSATAAADPAPQPATALDFFWSPAWRAHVIAAGALTVALIVLYAPTWGSMVAVWKNSVTYNHGFFVAPVALFLAWLRKDLLAKATPAFEPLAAVPALGFGALWLLGHAGYVQLFQHVGVVGMLVCGLVGALGRQPARVIAFPLAFLFFLVPFGDEFIPALQTVTADFTVGFMRLFGFAIYRDGVFLETVGGRFEVAEACAGIRFLVANVVIAALLSHLSYDRWWKHAAFMGVALIVPIIANGFRAFGIVLIATLTNGEVATGVDHLVYGWGFFAAIMLLLIWIGTSFADRRVGDPPESLVLPPAPTREMGAAPALGVLAAGLCFAGLYGYGVVDRAGADGVANPIEPAAERIEFVDDWTGIAPRADETVTNVYAIGGAPVTLFQATFLRERPGKELIHSQNRSYDGEKWLRFSTFNRPFEIAGETKRARVDVVGRFGGQRLALTLYRIGDTYYADPNKVKLEQALRRLTGRIEPGALIILSVPVAGTAASDRQAALDTLSTAVATLLPAEN